MLFQIHPRISFGGEVQFQHSGRVGHDFSQPGKLSCFPEKHICISITWMVTLCRFPPPLFFLATKSPVWNVWIKLKRFDGVCKNTKSKRFKLFKAKLPLLIYVIALLWYGSPCLGGPEWAGFGFFQTCQNLHFLTAAGWALTSAKPRLQSCIIRILLKNTLCCCCSEEGGWRGGCIPCGRLREGTNKSPGNAQPWNVWAAVLK